MIYRGGGFARHERHALVHESRRASSLALRYFACPMELHCANAPFSVPSQTRPVRYVSLSSSLTRRSGNSNILHMSFFLASAFPIHALTSTSTPNSSRSAALPSSSRMLFVAPLPPSSSSSSFTTSLSPIGHPATHPLPAAPCRRVLPFCALTRSKTQPSKPTVRVARNPHELHLVYSVWNAVLEHDELATIAPDEIDSSSSTVHFLAYTPEKKLAGAARLLRIDENARLDRVWVLPEYRGIGVGRALVENLLVLASPAQGAVFVNATHGELGFFSIMGFESLGTDRLENRQMVRTMVYRFPVCAPSTGCVGLHHTSIRVCDIEKSLAFYGSLGFFVTEKFHTSAGSRACFVEGLGTRLEFVESKNGQGGLQGLQGIPPIGFDRLVFNVTKACTDLSSFLAHLERKNGGVLDVAAEPARQVIGSDVVSVATITDPDGLPIEFIRHEAQIPGELRARIKW